MSSTTAEYYTHDNGGRPFRVTINNGASVQIYKQRSDTDGYEAKAAWTGEAARVWVGGDRSDDPDDVGNSILLQTKDEKDNYVFIGSRVAQFRALAPIVFYFSPVGNSDVAYPFAIDNLGHYYLIIEEVVIQRPPPNESHDPYKYYYARHLITRDFGARQEPVTTIPFDRPTKFFIGRKPYTLTYHPHPLRGYESNMSLVKSDQTVERFTETTFCEYMKNYGDAAGFTPLYLQIIIDRQ